METEDDNTVVKEIDVFLSKQYLNSLYVFQYPVRPSNISYNKLIVLEARMRPKQQKVEVHIALDTFSKNYDKSVGEQWATDVDGKDPVAASRFYKTDKMDKQILSASPVGIDNNTYSIGIFRNNELHITPLTTILQLRPDLSYIDRMDARKLKNRKKDADSDDDDTITPVIAKYAPKENEEARSKRLASYEFLRNQQDDEPWITMKTRSLIKGDKYCPDKNLLFAEKNLNQPSPEFSMPTNEFLDLLLPRLTTEAKNCPSLPSNVVSMSDIKLKPVTDQIKILLECAKVMKFDKLVSILPKDSDLSTILRYLQQVGMLVQGCWVYKSELLYSGETNSGINSETLCRVRDFVLWTFSQYKSITRKDMTSIAKLPAEEEKELLSKIAKRRLHSRDWEFIMEEDLAFINRNLDITQRQARIWDKKYSQIMSSIKDKKPTNVKQRTKSGDKLSESDTDGSDLGNLTNVPSVSIEPTSIISTNKPKLETNKRKVSFSLDGEFPIRNKLKEDNAS